jgi:hypothetical protein
MTIAERLDRIQRDLDIPLEECYWNSPGGKWITIAEVYGKPLAELDMPEGKGFLDFRYPVEGEAFRSIETISGIAESWICERGYRPHPISGFAPEQDGPRIILRKIERPAPENECWWDGRKWITVERVYGKRLADMLIGEGSGRRVAAFRPAKKGDTYIGWPSFNQVVARDDFTTINPRLILEDAPARDPISLLSELDWRYEFEVATIKRIACDGKTLRVWLKSRNPLRQVAR